MDNDLSIIERTKNFVSIFLEALPVSLLYHNLTHTREVVAAVIEIASHENLTSEELEIAQLAAWFHDIGYVLRYDGHEEESATIARQFLDRKQYQPDKLNKVIGCIRSTKYPQQPLTVIEKVVCDADLYHFSLKSYPDHEQLLRKEWEMHLRRFYSDAQWYRSNLQVLKNHNYHTPYGKIVLQSGKEANILSRMSS